MATPFRGGTVMRGHGALSNPAGRFEPRRTEAVEDGWFEEDLPEGVPLEVMPDRARTVISRNESPDVPFEQSINPYRGCSHACPYCLSGDTLILLADGSARRIAHLAVGSEIYGTLRRGALRRYVRTRVLAHWSVIKPAYRILLEDGTELVAGGDHRFLTGDGWKFVTATGAGPERRPHLTVNDTLAGTGRFASGLEKDCDYKRGYLCGLVRAACRTGAHRRADQSASPDLCSFLPPALCDAQAQSRVRRYLDDLRVPARDFRIAADAGTRGVAYGFGASGGVNLAHLRHVIAWPSAPTRAWCAGFLAGRFDADGFWRHGSVHFFAADPQLIDASARCLGAWGLRTMLDQPHAGRSEPGRIVRVLGGLREQLRFLHAVDPATRTLDIEGREVPCAARLRVVSIEPAGTMRLYDITSGSGDFIANGIVSHNCYARPSHAYLGLSPGLDFETRLFYKQDARRSLERELARPGYVCKPITLGSNTDPYQPIERRLRVTREVLEVLSRCRHPVTVITKGALVLRDLDLFVALAGDNLVQVGVSITTLDAELKRNLEPQAASPAARLRMVRELSAAGIPTGVLVAPLIPALTDHELEDIVQAAAEAGARWAGYVLLRLPNEVGALFREWLAAHYPERAAHVLSLIQQMRQGRDNDPRFGHRMRGTGPIAELLRARFHAACRRSGLNTGRGEALTVSLFRPPGQRQLTLEL